jgi:S-adenosylmethionine hydrolase
MAGVITLLTDFGSRDAYVGAIKGVILRGLPGAQIVDLCHEVAPQDVRGAAFLLESAFEHFPQGTVHMVVVDPGVGGPRRIVAADAGPFRFLAPDNGALCPSLERAGAARAVEVGEEAVREAAASCLPPGAVESTTFHGRDRFAPLAVRLALGAPIGELGREVRDLARLELPCPVSRGGGEVAGEVIHVDRFGNLVTNIGPGDLPGEDAAFEVAGRLVRGVVRAYVEREEGELLAVIGSTGRLEIALRGGSAAEALGARVGTPVVALPGGGGRST